jgi:hypothetical protein
MQNRISPANRSAAHPKHFNKEQTPAFARSIAKGEGCHAEVRRRRALLLIGLRLGKPNAR